MAPPACLTPQKNDEQFQTSAYEDLDEPSTETPKAYKKYTFAWIYVRDVGFSTANAMLDKVYSFVPATEGDSSMYIWGKAGKHHIAIVYSPAPIMSDSATGAAARLKQTFPSLRLILSVAIGCGVPGPARDLRLGDVAVGKRILQYELNDVKDGKSRRVAETSASMLVALSDAIKASH